MARRAAAGMVNGRGCRCGAVRMARSESYFGQSESAHAHLPLVLGLDVRRRLVDQRHQPYIPPHRSRHLDQAHLGDRTMPPCGEWGEMRSRGLVRGDQIEEEKDGQGEQARTRARGGSAWRDFYAATHSSSSVHCAGHLGVEESRGGDYEQEC